MDEPMHEKKSIFLSHNRHDKPFVKRVFKELVKREVRCWFAEAEILPGDSLIEKIEKGISEIDYLVVFVSEDSIKSPWVKKELNVALTREIGGHPVKVIPIMIGSLTDDKIPPMIADKYYIDFRGANPFEKGLHELLMILDDRYAEGITKIIEFIESPDEMATAIEGILFAGGIDDIGGIAELYHYHEIYRQMGIEIEKVFDMFEPKLEGAVERLSQTLRRDLPYPLWERLANVDILTRLLRGFGKKV